MEEQMPEDMEEQMPELVDDTENNDSNASEGQQLRTFEQAHLNNMGATTENLGQSINVTFAVDNEVLEIPLQTHMYS